MKNSSFVVGYPGRGYCLWEGKVGLHHVTVSHHLCETVKYRVWKARNDIDTDNISSFIEVFYFIVDYFVGSWKITLSTEEVSQRNLCRGMTK